MYRWYLVHSLSIAIILFPDEHEGQEIRLWGPGQIIWKIGLIGMPPVEVCFLKVWSRAQKGGIKDSSALCSALLFKYENLKLLWLFYLFFLILFSFVVVVVVLTLRLSKEFA